MSGTGKYTQYTAPTVVGGKDVTKKVSRLRKLFSDKYNDKTKVPPHLTVDPGKEKDARDETVALAKQLLTPTNQSGDPGHFPTGVNLDYASATDLTEVKWSRPGDPANPYVPDLTSPGVPTLLGTDKSSDPQVSPDDIKPNYEPGNVGSGTQSPKKAAQKISESSVLGQEGKLGSSGDKEYGS